MQRSRWLAVALGAALLGSSGLSRAEPAERARNGRFEVVTYNVAGLPEGLSKVHPVANLPVIGGLLNQFDLALVQEDFAYPALLRQKLRLPYRSTAFVRGEALHFGDGLSLFSKLPLADVTRVPWATCHGVVDSFFDCLTPKGIASSRVEVSPGLSLDVYTVHLDAGVGEGDVKARQGQLQQLADLIRRTPRERPVVLGGDFNLTGGELAGFRLLFAELGLVDVCDALGCGQAWRLDRILFRSGASLSLQPASWRLVPHFKDARRRPLSDHEPVAARFDWWTTAAKPAGG